MNGAVFALAFNAGMALLFAARFAVIALSYHAQRSALGFCAAYVIVALFLIGMVLRAIIWGGARSTIGYELVYQVPFAIAAVLTAVTAVRVGRSRSLSLRRA